jgi:3'(2'), 5'-bisphosphate nucleotidase
MTMDDSRLAHDLAAEAGQRLLSLRAAGGDPADLRKQGDRQSHEFLAAELARLRPADAVLSEEGRDNLARLAADRVWIVDPLDGTREFGEPGRSDWAVHVALWERGELTAGAVALPAQGTVLSTAQPPSPPPPPPGGPLRVLVSRTRPPALLDRLAEEIPLTLVPLGSAGAKAAAVISGAADAYVHSGGQYEWDSAAPVAVVGGRGGPAPPPGRGKKRFKKAGPNHPGGR